MPYRASVARVAASNKPMNPGELGSATPKPMIPCSRNAPAGGTGSPNARKQTANAAAFTSHCTTDQNTTARKRPGVLSTSRHATEQREPGRGAMYHQHRHHEHSAEHSGRGSRDGGDRRPADVGLVGKRGRDDPDGHPAYEHQSV